MNPRDLHRVLLCRPRGGLNDTLSRIEQCWRYAERTRRHLVVDASRSALHGPFGAIFALIGDRGGVTASADAALLASLDRMVCRPTELQGRIMSYEVGFERGIGFVDAASGVPTRFAARVIGPDTPDYPEPLLVYEDSGGGSDSFRLLERIRFTDSVASALRAALAEIGSSYVAVHVRNSDYRTDYMRLFARIKRRVRGHPVLVCSDDPGVADHARRALGVAVVVPGGHAESADPAGTLHTPRAYSSVAERQRAAFLALRDLVMLANAVRLYAAPVEQMVKGEVLRASGRIEYRGVPRGRMSGFSMLAQHLCVRKDVLDGLLGVPPDERRRVDPTAAVIVQERSIWLRQNVRRWLHG